MSFSFLALPRGRQLSITRKPGSSLGRPMRCCLPAVFSHRRFKVWPWPCASANRSFLPPLQKCAARGGELAPARSPCRQSHNTLRRRSRSSERAFEGPLGLRSQGKDPNAAGPACPDARLPRPKRLASVPAAAGLLCPSQRDGCRGARRERPFVSHHALGCRRPTSFREEIGAMPRSPPHMYSVTRWTR